MKTHCLFNSKAGRFSEGALEKAFRGREFWGEVRFQSLGSSRSQKEWPGRIADGDKVVVLGGDGTIHHVIQHLAFRPVELSVVPAGTANDLGYCLGVAGGLRKSMDLLEQGRVLDYDTIGVNGRHVITGGGFGLGYQAAATANRLRAGALGPLYRLLRAKIYLLTLGWHGFFSPPRKEPFKLRVDGGAKEQAGVTQSILFCNQSLMGKRVLIAPGTTGTDGRFHLLQFLHEDTSGILRALAGMKANAILAGPAADEAPDPLLRRAELESAALEFDNPVPAYGDGEEFPAQRHWDLRCHRGSIRLRVPASFGNICAA